MEDLLTQWKPSFAKLALFIHTEDDFTLGSAKMVNPLHFFFDGWPNAQDGSAQG